MIKKLERELADIKKRLLHYENSNASFQELPPLQRDEAVAKQEQTNRENDDCNASSALSKKPGRRNEHVGVTQVFAPSGNPTIHKMDRCPNCNSTRLSVTSTEKRIFVDVPEPVPYSVREQVINVYECSR